MENSFQELFKKKQGTKKSTTRLGVMLEGKLFLRAVLRALRMKLCVAL
jgi:hypothetical protein